MALRAGYYGLKRFERNKLSILAASTPADISPDNPIAGKNDVLTSIDLLDDTVGWLGIQMLKHPYEGVADGVEFTNEGITYVTNALDYSVLVKSGTSTGYSERAFFSRGLKDFKLESGVKYVIKGGTDNIAFTVGTGSGEDGSTGSYVVVARSRGEAVEFIAPDKWLTVSIQVTAAGITIPEDTVVYPILYKADDYKLISNYVPYHANIAELLNSKMSKGRMLTSADDLNNITDTGIYAFSTSPVNAPEGVVYGTLIVEGNSSGSTGVRQLIIISGTSSGVIYTRGYFGSPQTWKSWFKFTGTEVTPPAPTPENETKKATKKKVIKEEEE